MRFLHVSNVDVAVADGSSEHVLGWAQGLGELGHEAVVLAPASGLPIKQGRYQVRTARFDGGPFARAAAVGRAVTQAIDQVKPDVLYLRSFPLDFWYVVRRVRRTGTPLIVELNTMARHQHQALGLHFRAPALARFEALTLRSADAWAPLTPEIHAYAAELSGTNGKASALAFNAFDVTDLPTLDVRQETRRTHGVGPDDTVLVMAGFGFPWNGVDRAIHAMELLDPSHHLWLVGARNESDRRLVEAHASEEVRPRIRVFGVLAPDALVELFAGADVGLGSLAFDRHTLTQAQPMKVALYLALGLPIVINYDDVRFSNDPPFVAQVASNEPAAVRDALERLKPITPALREQTARYASHHLSWREAARHTVALSEAVLQVAD